jgi:transmembrane sensor
MTFVETMTSNPDTSSHDRPDNRSSIDQEAYTWVMRFASGHASETDIAALQQWSRRDPAHAEAFRRISQTWKGLGELRLDERGAPHPLAAPVARRLGRRAFLGGAIAASAAGAAVLVARPPLGLWPSLSELAADYRTATGEQRQVVLADNTSIDMNTQTSIAVRSSEDGGSGVDLISGEAVFVAPAQPSGRFAVHAANGRILASDARFNVRYQDNGVCVTCLKGEVRIEQGSAMLSLSPQRQAIYSDRGISSVMVADPAHVTAWQEGVVIFQLTPVSEVVTEVNRYRSGKIILTNQQLGRRLFNARLRIANIDLVVSRIEQVFGARATTLPGGITLLG